MNERIKINVIIANRRYPMSIFPHEESAIRRAVKEIDLNIKKIEAKYDIQDKQDALSMCLLQYCSKFKINDLNKEKEETKIQSQIEEIIKKIDDFL